MSKNLYLEPSRNSRRRRQGPLDAIPYLVLVPVLIVLVCIAGFLYFRDKANLAKGAASPNVQSEQTPDPEAFTASSEDSQEANATAIDELSLLLAQAELLAAGYDYDNAINLLTSSAYADNEMVTTAVASYEETKASLVKINPYEITHVFFHSLIMDTAKAFDGDHREAGYNQVMTTKEEFMKILQSMYDKGFVLVRLHDVAYETTREDSTTGFTPGEIMLPPGKQAFVMSQDDVCYYEYMKGDGFATKMVIDDDGTPTCEMELEDGTVLKGSYDLVPLLDDFIAEHPDFSYKGAKAVIAFTGYNGILGYRTAASYNTPEYLEKHPGFDYEKEREEAARVAQCLKDNGYELASHSWGHRNMGQISMEHFIADTDKWEAEVETLTGPCDIILFPFGSDLGDWMPYAADNKRFQYMYSKGFRYFCNVDSSQYWVQINDKYMRQGRRNLDGYRIYYDLPESNPSKDHLSDLFDPAEIFDRRRPTPVPKMTD